MLNPKGHLDSGLDEVSIFICSFSKKLEVENFKKICGKLIFIRTRLTIYELWSF